MLFEPFQQYKANGLHFGFAEAYWELKNYYRLRNDVFCKEQKIFTGSDADQIDETALPIICTSECMGMPDQVIGAVRIHELSPAVWMGSRLAVHAEYRKFRNYNSYQLFNNNNIVWPFTMSIGASLIFKAVTSAQTMACSKFIAYVQHQNVNFFERLHWKSIEAVTLHGYLHYLMEADLDYYPASDYINRELKNTA